MVEAPWPSWLYMYIYIYIQIYIYVPLSNGGGVAAAVLANHGQVGVERNTN